MDSYKVFRVSTKYKEYHFLVKLFLFQENYYFKPQTSGNLDRTLLTIQGMCEPT